MSNFNPYDHLTVSLSKDGIPIYEVLLDNGLPVTVSVGNTTGYKMVPKRYLNAVGYRRWFKSEYPNGSIDIEDVTPPPFFDAVGKQIVAQKETKVKCTLYADRKKEEFLASSYGASEKRKYTNEELNPDYREIDPSFSFAQASAIRNAMTNAGFILDTNELSELQKNLPTYVEDILLSEDSLGVSPFEPIVNERACPGNDDLDGSDDVSKNDQVPDTMKEITPQSSTSLNSYSYDAEIQLEDTGEENDFSKRLAKRAHSIQAQDQTVPNEAEIALKEQENTLASAEEQPGNQDNPENGIIESKAPENVLFAISPTCDNEKIKSLIGKTIGELSPAMLKAFSAEAYRKLLSEETYNAIVALI